MNKYKELIKFWIAINGFVLLGKLSADIQVWLWKRIDDAIK